MAPKITLITLSILGIFILNEGAFAQEEGGTEEKSEVIIPIVPVDSSIVYDRQGTDQAFEQPVSTPFNIPVSELLKTKPSGSIPSETDKLVPEGQNKVKENKQEFSFNIIYYLIYKFKQVDN